MPSRLLPATAAVIVMLAATACTAASRHQPAGTPTTKPPSGSPSASQGTSAAGPVPSASATPSAAPPGPASAGGAITKGLVPLPVAAQTDPAATFTLDAGTQIAVEPGTGAVAVGNDLAALLRPATGYPLPVHSVHSSESPGDAVVLRLAAAEPALGDEGYDLTVTTKHIVIAARQPAGLFYGVQTLRQLLPASIEATAQQPGPWQVVGGRIVDHPRFSYRGAMLDVARHFFTVAEVERYIDELALYKVNVLHLHLSDDQGWRLAIDGWPRLATHGGSTEVGGGPGGFYTKDQYRAIVRYAQDRFITVVPEIDTPSHATAALSSYPQLTCTGVAPPLATAANATSTALCTSKATVYAFLDDVVGELAALTPGPYIDLGGDEAQAVSAVAYKAYIEKAQAIVAAHGKKLMGWADIAQAQLHSSSVAEYWNFKDKGATMRAAVSQGVKVVAAPANHAYLDQKYDPNFPLGLDWAGDISVEAAYSWDPTDGGIATDSDLLGVEAPLWSETVRSMADAEYLAWPRMAGIAEVGWTPKAERAWTTYQPRLAQQAPRCAQLGIHFYRSPEVAWAA